LSEKGHAVQEYREIAPSIEDIFFSMIGKKTHRVKNNE